MYSVIKKLKDSISWLVLSKHEYKEAVPKIRVCNFKSLVVASFSGCVIFGVLTFLTFFNLPVESRAKLLLYGACFLIFTVVFLFCIFFIKPESKYVTWGVYTYMTVLYLYGIHLGVILQPEITAVAFCVALVACPAVFTEKTWRIGIYSVCITVLFCCLSVSYKRPELAYIDIMNGVSFCIIGIILNFFMNYIRIRDIVLFQTLKDERDRDGLTGLLNKTALTREIKKQMLIPQTDCMLLLLDLDDFKRVNDIYGHVAGDKIIADCAECIKNVFSSHVCTGRFGGDEFIVFVPDSSSTAELSNRASDLLNQISKKCILPDSSDIMHGSIGIARSMNGKESYLSLFQKADEAMYSAKQRGKNQVVISDK